MSTKRNISLLILSFFYLTSPLYAQDQLAGIINTYAKVIDLFPCGHIQLESSDAFQIGDSLLIIQMKGAEIDESNSTSYGTVQNYGVAGQYEKIHIADIDGNHLILSHQLLNTYEPDHGVQVVSFPQYEKVIITEPLLAKPWDGQTGGIIALSVSDSLVMQADIQADGLGFRGGASQTLASNCLWLFAHSDYFYAQGNWRGALKGEGISISIPGKEGGRGPQANGGGGGNDHNSGGGGGGNRSSGGKGGELSLTGIFDCNGVYPGIGGRSLDISDQRLFLGGGGGAGHVDNNIQGNQGAQGGGIILIQANSLYGNGFKISANGRSASTAQGDGGGGGGAGGTVLVQCSNLFNLSIIEALGGKGGDTQNSSDRCYGPGGGGSGGVLYTNASPLPSTNLTGGQSGQNTIANTVCNSTANGAEAGMQGQLFTNASIPVSNIPTQPTLVQTPQDSLFVCSGDTLNIDIVAQGLDLEYQWQISTDAVLFEDIEPSNTFWGSQTPSLFLQNDSSLQDSFYVRCIVFNSCGETTFDTPCLIYLRPSPQSNFSFLQNQNTLTFSDESTLAQNVEWDFGDGASSTEPSPTHTYLEEGLYIVTQRVFNSCGVDSSSSQILVGQGPQALFSSSLTQLCVPQTIQFFSLTTNNDSIQWYFEGGTPSFSSQEAPIITYEEEGQFDISLIVFKYGLSDSLIQPLYIEAEEPIYPDFTFENNENQTSFYTTFEDQFGYTYQWDFGDGSSPSNDYEPTHIYEESGYYLVQLELSHGGCSEIISRWIFVEFTTNLTESSILNQIYCYPNPVMDVFNIRTESTDQNKEVELSIYNLLGQPIRSVDLEKTGPNLYQVSLGHLPTGRYLAYIRLGDEWSVHQFMKED